MKKLLTLAALFLGMALGAGPVAAAPVQPIAFDFTLGAGDVCAFPVHVVATGKGKTIDLPGPFAILPAPGLKVTFTNTDAGKSVSYVITGATHTQTLANGDVVSTVTGRNTLINNKFSARPGIFLVVGTFHFTLDKDGNEVKVFNSDGPGRVTNVCALLA